MGSHRRLDNHANLRSQSGRGLRHTSAVRPGWTGCSRWRRPPTTWSGCRSCWLRRH